MPKPVTKNPLDRFSLASSIAKPRLIWAGFGEVGTGKTTFGLQAPGPIVVFSLDKGLEGVVEPFVENGKEIRIREYDWSPPPVDDDTPFEEREEFQKQAQEIRQQFEEDFEIAVNNARTVLLDKETDVWELFRYAEFGAPNDAPRNYPALNQRYRRLINMPKATDINFGCIQGMKDEWVTRQKNDGSGKSQGHNTGQRRRQGFADLDALVHIDLRHRRGKNEESEQCFFIDVGKARGPGGYDLQDTTQENLTFSEFAQLVFPETGPEDWE